jgi:hypothetical protein
MRSEAMAISEIHHVALTVSDLEKSTAFYKDVLGFRKILDMPPGGPALQRMLKLRPGTKSRAVILQQGLSTVGQIELIAFDPPADKDVRVRSCNHTCDFTSTLPPQTALDADSPSHSGCPDVVQSPPSDTHTRDMRAQWLAVSRL